MASRAFIQASDATIPESLEHARHLLRGIDGALSELRIGELEQGSISSGFVLGAIQKQLGEALKMLEEQLGSAKRMAADLFLLLDSSHKLSSGRAREGFEIAANRVRTLLELLEAA